jgi:hypothetical protein
MANKQTKPLDTNATPETKFTKEQLMATATSGAQRDLFSLALKSGMKYTYNEALNEADKLKGGLF